MRGKSDQHGHGDKRWHPGGLLPPRPDTRFNALPGRASRPGANHDREIDAFLARMGYRDPGSESAFPD
jgi:hypothetical protein